MFLRIQKKSVIAYSCKCNLDLNDQEIKQICCHVWWRAQSPPTQLTKTNAYKNSGTEHLHSS